MSKKVPLPTQPLSPSPTQFYKVQKIIGMKLEQNRTFYKIKWRGYSTSQSTWQPEQNLSKAKLLVERYKKANIKRLTVKADKIQKSQRLDNISSQKVTKLPIKHRQISTQIEIDLQHDINCSIGEQVGRSNAKINNNQQSQELFFQSSSTKQQKCFQFLKEEEEDEVECVVDIMESYQIKVRYKSGEQGFISREEAYNVYYKQYIEFLQNRMQIIEEY